MTLNDVETAPRSALLGLLDALGDETAELRRLSNRTLRVICRLAITSTWFAQGTTPSGSNLKLQKRQEYVQSGGRCCPY